MQRHEWLSARHFCSLLYTWACCLAPAAPVLPAGAISSDKQTSGCYTMQYRGPALGQYCCRRCKETARETHANTKTAGAVHSTNHPDGAQDEAVSLPGWNPISSPALKSFKGATACKCWPASWLKARLPGPVAVTGTSSTFSRHNSTTPGLLGAYLLGAYLLWALAEAESGLSHPLLMPRPATAGHPVLVARPAESGWKGHEEYHLLLFLPPGETTTVAGRLVLQQKAAAAAAARDAQIASYVLITEYG